MPRPSSAAQGGVTPERRCTRRRKPCSTANRSTPGPRSSTARDGPVAPSVRADAPVTSASRARAVRRPADPLTRAVSTTAAVVGAAREDDRMPRFTTPLIGRARELATLADALGLGASAPRVGGRVVVLDGDAGIGKTRLLREVVERARIDGRRVLVGQCVDLGEAPPPYLPFRDLFARLELDEPVLTDALREQHPGLGRLLPRDPGRAGAVTVVPVDGADRADRGELFAAVGAALQHISAHGPALLVVEDVHWTDQASRDLLGYLFAG